MRKPWFRKQDGWWYITVVDGSGKRGIRRLSQDKADAEKHWHSFQAITKNPSERTLLEVAEARWAWSSRAHSASTVSGLVESVGPFVAAYGRTACQDLRLHHATAWITDRKMPPGAERAFVIYLKAMFNWAVKQGLVAQNPFRHLPRPRQGKREALVSEAQQRSILEATDGAFRCVAIALMKASCRPQAVRQVTAGHFHPDEECWVFPPRQHKTGKATGAPLVVYLSPCLVTLCRILARHRPDGPLFLNSAGNPWTEAAVTMRMRRLRKKLGLPAGTVAYSYRHTFTTNGLKNGVDVTTMATLLGHGNTEQIRKHYGHLDKHGSHLRAAVRQANSRGTPQSPASPPLGPETSA